MLSENVSICYLVSVGLYELDKPFTNGTDMFRGLLVVVGVNLAVACAFDKRIVR